MVGAVGRPRGNPNFFKKGAQHPCAVQKEVKPMSNLKTYQVAHLVDKNAKTIFKIVQLLEISQQPGVPSEEPGGHVVQRIDKLRKRLNRRLVKLAKWSDIPQEERLPRMTMRTVAAASAIPSYSSSLYSNNNNNPYMPSALPTAPPARALTMDSAQMQRSIGLHAQFPSMPQSSSAASSNLMAKYNPQMISQLQSQTVNSAAAAVQSENKPSNP